MSGRGASGVDNTQRRKWDKGEYAAKAAERQRQESEASADAQRAQVSASLGIVVRKALNQQDMISRDFNAELRAKVGTKTLINPEDPGAAGFYCKETGKTLRDSISYLDHINGKRQQKALGMSMRVERSTLEEVQERFSEHRRRKEEQQRAEPSFQARVACAEEEEERQRAARRERKLQKRKQQEQLQIEAAPEEGLDPEMAALMGFSGFGGPKPGR